MLLITSLTSSNFILLQYSKSQRHSKCSKSSNTIILSPSLFKSLWKYIYHLRLICVSFANILSSSSLMHFTFSFSRALLSVANRAYTTYCHFYPLVRYTFNIQTLILIDCCNRQLLHLIPLPNCPFFSSIVFLHQLQTISVLLTLELLHSVTNSLDVHQRYPSRSKHLSSYLPNTISYPISHTICIPTY